MSDKILVSVTAEKAKMFLSELQFVVAFLDEKHPSVSGKLCSSIDEFYSQLHDGPERACYADPGEIIKAT